MLAKFSSKCPGCKGRIVPGAPITMVKGRGWHVRCAPATKAKPPARPHHEPKETLEDVIDRI
jgi:hypothetical protein